MVHIDYFSIPPTVHDPCPFDKIKIFSKKFFFGVHMIVLSNDVIFAVNLPVILDLVVVPSNNNRPRMSSAVGGVKPQVSSDVVKALSYFCPF